MLRPPDRNRRIGYLLLAIILLTALVSFLCGYIFAGLHSAL